MDQFESIVASMNTLGSEVMTAGYFDEMASSNRRLSSEVARLRGLCEANGVRW